MGYAIRLDGSPHRPAVGFGCRADWGYEMDAQFVLSDYTSELMAHATYDTLEDGTFSGRIPE